MDLGFLKPCDKPDRIGLLDYYEIIEVIGRGGMGVVLRGLDTKLHRIVAIKVLAPELAANAVARNRFEREARAVAAVSHDHVITIFAVDEVDECGKLPYIVMECIVGRSLQEAIDETGSLEVARVLRIGTQVASGLAAAHAQGLVHRDIKPANILLENSVERVKITDFGIARAVDDVSVTKTGETACTPQYMSPEQAEGKRVDHRSDLFSLGSVLYAMCAGRAAFRGESSLAVLRRVCDDMPRPIREVNPDVPPWLAKIIEKLLAKHPDERFQTAAEVSELLEEHLAQLQSRLSADDSQPPVSMESNSASPRSRRIGLTIAVVLLIAVGSLAVTESAGITRFSGLFVSAARQEPTQDAPGTADENRNDRESSAPKKPAEDHAPAPFKAADFKTTDENQLSSYEILTSDQWEWTEPENLGPGVNTEASETRGQLSADGLTLLFVSNRSVKNQNEKPGRAKLWMSRRDSLDQPFAEAVRLGPSVKSSDEQDFPTISGDGLVLVFFARAGVVPPDLWMSTRESPNDDWSQAVNLGPNINGPVYDSLPFLSADGLSLWYNTHRPPRGPWTLRRSTRASRERPWPKSLIVISGENHATDPIVMSGVSFAADGLSRLYSHLGMRLDTRPDRDRPWSEAVSLDRHVQTRGNREYSNPFLSADGKTILFNSTRSGGFGQADLWMIRRVKKK